MERQTVSSSNLRSVGYDQDSSTLEIEFLDGGVYQYSGVPAHHHSGLMGAGSKGTYFDRHIKKGGYGYRKIR